MLDTLYSQIGALVWLGVCAFAILKGEQTERIGAGALLIAWAASLAVHRDTSFAGASIAVMAIDVVVLLVLVGLSWKSDRSWPIWAAGFQLILVLVHIVMAVDIRIRAIAYLSAMMVATYGVLVCLAVGTFWAWQEREAIKPPD